MCGKDLAGIFYDHFVFFPVRLMASQRTEFTWFTFAVKRSIALLSQTGTVFGKQILGLVYIVQLIIVFSNHVNAVRGVVGHILEQAGFLRHACKHRIESGCFG